MVTIVSIHAFREGRRRKQCDVAVFRRCFNPRLPRGKATGEVVDHYSLDRVSIHAFREGRRQV